MRVNSPPQCLFPPTPILTFHRKLKTEATQSWMPTLIPCRITYIMRAMDFLVGTPVRWDVFRGPTVATSHRTSLRLNNSLVCLWPGEVLPIGSLR